MPQGLFHSREEAGLLPVLVVRYILFSTPDMSHLIGGITTSRSFSSAIVYLVERKRNNCFDSGFLEEVIPPVRNQPWCRIYSPKQRKVRREWSS